MSLDIGKISALACSLSEHWLRIRPRNEPYVGQMPMGLVQDLDALEKITRGNVLRCSCIAGKQGRPHDVRCGAGQPSDMKNLSVEEAERLYGATSAAADLVRQAHTPKRPVDRSRKPVQKEEKYVGNKRGKPEPQSARMASSKAKKLRITGPTYDLRDKLKGLSGVGWEAVLKTWIVVDPDPKTIAKIEKFGLGLEEL